MQAPHGYQRGAGCHALGALLIIESSQHEVRGHGGEGYRLVALLMPVAGIGKLNREGEEELAANGAPAHGGYRR